MTTCMGHGRSPGVFDGILFYAVLFPRDALDEILD